MRLKVSGINAARTRLSSGEVKTYYYHRSTGTRLAGAPGTAEFLASFAAAEHSLQIRNIGTLSCLIRKFEGTKQWRRLADSTKKEYKRVFKFWDFEYGTCPYRALEDKAFRTDDFERGCLFLPDSKSGPEDCHPQRPCSRGAQRAGTGRPLRRVR